MQKKEVGLYFILYIKLTWNGLKTQIKVKIMTLFKETTGVSLYNLGFGNNFLDMTSKAQVMKKRDKLDFLKMKSLED